MAGEFDVQGILALPLRGLGPLDRPRGFARAIPEDQRGPVILAVLDADRGDINGAGTVAASTAHIKPPPVRRAPPQGYPDPAPLSGFPAGANESCRLPVLLPCAIISSRDLLQYGEG